MTSRFYITTPIYYINDVPHLGTAYSTIAADVLSRYHRLRGQECWFLTGTDEHGLKIQRAAETRGMKPLALADEISAQFREAWPKLGCAPDDFIRTSEPRHHRGVQELWRTIEKNGDIYLGHYEGLYCVGCEGYYTEKDLTQPGNICPIHGKPAEMLKEESYFFRLSRYTTRLLEFYAEHPTFVQPASRLNEVTSFVSAGLTDLSVSRTTFQWGIPVPGDPRHVMFVWFDALANYYTALSDPEDRTRFWPASIHLVGKDILRFHAIYWPAFLMSAGMSGALPGQVFAHGFLTYCGQKMSKSLRNTISPVALAEALSPEVGVDTLRYCLMRAISFGQDGDFSIDNLLERYASELGNALGNLLNRVLPFASEVPEKAAIGPLEEDLAKKYAAGALAAQNAFQEPHPGKALDAIWTIVAEANTYVDRAAPWAAKKTDPARLGTIVATLVELLEGVSVMVAPVMPVVSQKMREQLGLNPLKNEVGRDQWPLELPARAPGGLFHPGKPIFPRLEKEKAAELIQRFSAPPPEGDAGAAATKSPEAAQPPATKAAVTHDDFSRLDIRVGIVVSAERIKKKDKLLDLRVDTGDASPRRIIAGIAGSYAPESLVGRRILVLCNLLPRDFGKGLISEGMLLAANAGGELAVTTVAGDLAAGTPVR
jgi:methionyl-tRNA synthetase